MKRDENQSDNLCHLKTVCLDVLPCHSIGLFCAAVEDYPYKVETPNQDKTNYIFTETDFIFHQDLLVLILVSY